MTPTEQIRRAQEVFDVEIEGLRRTRAALGDAFTRTVALMLACVEAGGKVVGKMAVLAEGDAQKRDDIIVLGHLPLFRPDGSIIK